MKTRTETVSVPEETYTQTFYGCDHCPYETQDEEDLKGHHAKEHAVKKETTIGTEKFYWFDSKEDGELWLDPPGERGIADYTSVEWSGPGWYGSETHEGTGRCRCGGCSHFTTTLFPMATFVERWRKDITKHEAGIEACLKHIEAAKQLNP